MDSDRSGKRHLLQHVWFEEWIITLRCRLCSTGEEGRRSYTRVFRKASDDESLTCAGTSLRRDNHHHDLEAAPSGSGDPDEGQFQGGCASSSEGVKISDVILGSKFLSNPPCYGDKLDMGIEGIEGHRNHNPRNT
jgi:hypothetical protein